jgi:hypothetical protein
MAPSSAAQAASMGAQEEELFHAVEEQLEEKGLLATIRAQLRAAVFEAIVGRAASVPAAHAPPRNARARRSRRRRRPARRAG